MRKALTVLLLLFSTTVLAQVQGTHNIDNMRSKGSPWTDVTNRAFGATGDGSTDDTAAIELAIAALPDPGVLYFPPGTYIISNTLDLGDRGNITVRGAGQGVSIIKWIASATTGGFMLKLAPTGAESFVTVTGLSLIDPASAQHCDGDCDANEQTHGIDVTGTSYASPVSYVSISDVYVEGVGDEAISIIRARRVNIHDVVLKDNVQQQKTSAGGAIGITSSSEVQISNVDCVSNDNWHCIRIEGPSPGTADLSYIKINNILVDSPRHVGGYCDDGGGADTANDGQIGSTEDDTTCDSDADCTNECLRTLTQGAGIVVSNANYDLEQLSIEDVTCIDPDGACVSVNSNSSGDTTQFRISGVQVKGGANDGDIEYGGTSKVGAINVNNANATQCVISDNQVYRWGPGSVVGGVDRTANNNYFGIFVTSEYCNVSNNQVFEVSGGGVRLESASSMSSNSGNVVFGIGACDDGASAGDDVLDADELTVCDDDTDCTNDCLPAGTGIWMEGLGSAIGNTVQHFNSCIYTESGAETLIASNTVEDCANNGIRCDGCLAVGNSITTDSTENPNAIAVAFSGTDPEAHFNRTGSNATFFAGTGTEGLSAFDDMPLDYGSFQTLADDATPDVSGGTLWRTGGTTTITNFDCGGSVCDEGAEIFVHVNTTITFDFTSNTFMKGNNGADWNASQHDAMFCRKGGTPWYCIVSASGSSEWTNASGVVHPNTSATDEVAVGGTTEAGADIFLGADGDAKFNEQGNAVDVIIEGDTDTSLFQTDGSADCVNVASGDCATEGVALDIGGSAHATSFLTDGSDTPTLSFDDSEDATGTADMSLVGNCPTTGDCDLAFKTLVATVDTEAFRIDTTDAGVQSVIFTAPTDLPNNDIDSSEIATEVRSMFWGAGAISADGTQCAAPAEVTINSGPIMYSIICTDNDASTMYGHTVMPDSWDGGTVTFQLAYIQTAADTAVLNADVAAQCHAATETVNSTWGTEIAIDDAALTGSNAIDMTTSAAVTPAGTCAAGDALWWRIQLDATGTTTAVATLHFTGVKMEYTSNVGD